MFEEVRGNCPGTGGASRVSLRTEPGTHIHSVWHDDAITAYLETKMMRNGMMPRDLTGHTTYLGLNWTLVTG